MRAPRLRLLTPPCSPRPTSSAHGSARSHYENFTVASWLMPRAMRKHMHAIYAYARMADDFADEEHNPARLDEWERELDFAYAGAPRHPVFVALADTMRCFDIPREPFADLLRAFRSRPRLSRLRDARRPARVLTLLGRLPSAAWCSIYSAIATSERQASLRQGVQRPSTRQLLAGRRDRSRARGASIYRAAT